jgi:dynamin 1-like protein
MNRKKNERHSRIILTIHNNRSDTPNTAFDTGVASAAKDSRQMSLEVNDRVLEVFFDIHVHVDSHDFRYSPRQSAALSTNAPGKCVGPTREHVSAYEREKTGVPRQLPEKPFFPEPARIAIAYGASECRDTRSRLPCCAGPRYRQGARERPCPEGNHPLPRRGIRCASEAENTGGALPRADTVEFLREDPSMTGKRIACNQIVQALRKAQEILSELRTFRAQFEG